VEINSRYLV